MDYMGRHPRGLFGQWALIAVLTIVVYAPTFSGGFLLDDHPLIENNPDIHRIKPIHNYFLLEDGVVGRDQSPGEFHTGYYRPLVSLSYALDYHLWGNDSAGFRTTNLILHLAVCLALLALLHKHVGTDWRSMIAVLIFAIHPANSEAVAWVSSRNNIMAALFALLTLLFYADREQGRQVANRFMALLCFMLTLFSKEYGVMVLPILFVWNRTFGIGRQRLGAELAGYLPFGALLVVYFWLRTMAIGSVLSPHTVSDLAMRLLMAPYLILWNLRMVFLPIELHSFSVHYPSGGILLEVTGGFAGLALVCLLVWRLRQNRAAVMGALSFLLCLFPVLNIIPTSAVSLVSMRWLYFPMAFFAIAFCPPVFRVKWMRVGACLTALFIACLSGYTYFLNRYHWHDEAAFFLREVTVFGNNDYAGGLADILYERGVTGKAEIFFLQGIAARPDMVENYISYAALLIDTGRPDKALSVLDTISGKSMTRKSRGELLNNRAIALTRLGRVKEAVDEFEKAVTFAREDPAFWGNLGSAYAAAGDYARSAVALEKGLRLDPTSARLLADLALIRLELNDPQGAAAVFARLSDAEKRTRPNLAARIAAAEKGASAPTAP